MRVERKAQQSGHSHHLAGLPVVRSGGEELVCVDKIIDCSILVVETGEGMELFILFG